MMKTWSTYIVLWLSLLCLAVPSALADQIVKMGPILHFKGQNQRAGTWTVSALYLLDPNNSNRPVLHFGADGETMRIREGIETAKKFDFEYVQYTMSVQQTNEPQTVRYHFAGDREASYAFVVPALGENANLLYYSCNGYQKEAHREALGGIAPMWNKIYENHQKKPYHLQLGGGDQIYADGVIIKPGTDALEVEIKGIYGIFALPTVLQLFGDMTQFTEAVLSEETRHQIAVFYFNHYLLQYNQPGFKDVLAAVPAKNQADDHDYHDGFNSYLDNLQNSNLFKYIKQIASWHVGITQHGLMENELNKKNHTFLEIINDGKLAILGIDTRSERTAQRVLPPASLKKIFSLIESLDSSCKHLLVMLSVPVVYASTETMDKAIKHASRYRLTKKLGKFLGATNIFGEFELADDGRDGWSHPDHVAERDAMVAGFQDFAARKQIRVTFLSGDVHLGGVGKIYPAETGFLDKSPRSIYQIISSPVGNMPAGEALAASLGTIAKNPRSVGENSMMRLFKMTDVKTLKEPLHHLMNYRNFGSLQIVEDDTLNYRMSTENVPGGMSHTVYEINIPPAA